MLFLLLLLLREPETKPLKHGEIVQNCTDLLRFMKYYQLLGRRLADPTVLETQGVNFRRAAEPSGPATPMRKDKFL